MVLKALILYIPNKNYESKIDINYLHIFGFRVDEEEEPHQEAKKNPKTKTKNSQESAEKSHFLMIQETTETDRMNVRKVKNE